jgi:hypothetical protein
MRPIRQARRGDAADHAVGEAGPWANRWCRRPPNVNRSGAEIALRDHGDTGIKAVIVVGRAQQMAVDQRRGRIGRIKQRVDDVRRRLPHRIGGEAVAALAELHFDDGVARHLGENRLRGPALVKRQIDDLAGMQVHMLRPDRGLVDRGGIDQRIEHDVGHLGGVVIPKHLGGREFQRPLATNLDRRPGLVGLGWLVVEFLVFIGRPGLGTDAIGGVITLIGDDHLLRHVERRGVFLCDRNRVRLRVERDTDIVNRQSAKRPRSRAGRTWLHHRFGQSRMS